MGISQLTAFCGIHGGQFLFLSQTIPTSLSLRHLLFNLFRHVSQAKSVEHPINVRHSPDVSQNLGSDHYLSDFTDIVIRQHHGTPSKALAALSAVDPQLLGKLPFFSIYVKGKPDIVLNLYPRKATTHFQRFSSHGFFFSSTTAR